MERLLDVAKEAVEAWLRDRPYEAPRLPPPLDGPRAAFVTLRGPGGALRGCIGHLRPFHDHVAAEVADVAVGAATRDARFQPVNLEELPQLTWSISVLAPPEPIDDPSALDPARYGVILTSGSKRGVLLPDIPGVDTVEKQLSIARSKAGIAADAPVALQRFEVVTVGD